MPRRGAQALSGAVALLLGFGSMQVAILRSQAGTAKHQSVLVVAPVPFAPDDGAIAARDAAVQAADARRQADAAEAQHQADMQAQAEADRVAAERAESAAQASAAAHATTTTVRAPVATTAPVASGSGACGGDLPSCAVMNRESRGNPTAVNPTGCGGRGCFGKWQFDPITSRALGYPLTMDQYPESVQDDAARTLKAQEGNAPWGG